jgi:hypothetical protein
MQFGRVLSDSSDSDTESSETSNYRHGAEFNGKNDTISGSDIPSDEEEDDEDDVKVCVDGELEQMCPFFSLTFYATPESKRCFDVFHI